MLQLRSPPAATKTQRNQINNKYVFLKIKKIKIHLIYIKQQFDNMLPDNNVWTLELKSTHSPYIMFYHISKFLSSYFRMPMFLWGCKEKYAPRFSHLTIL